MTITMESAIDTYFSFIFMSSYPMLLCSSVSLFQLLVALLAFTFNNSQTVFCFKSHREKLTPQELVKLIYEERFGKSVPDMRRDARLELSKSHQPEGNEISSSTSVSSDEQPDALKSRKIWSRWSRWGECSVSCGSGRFVRRRVCVAGRCAPGEREEQWRPCSRQLCRAAPPAATTDDPDAQESSK